MISYLQKDKLTKSFGDLVLFEDITFGIAQGQKVGLIAKNGTGKTTLLNINRYTMLTTMIIVFLIGYLLIALEHPLKINKAGTALLTGTILWVLYTFGAPQFIPTASAEEFKLFLDAFPFIKDLPYADQCIRFVIDHQILDSIGEIAETLIFLIGAMITVELVDSHGGFMFITNRITTYSKRKLLFVIATITFFMSAVLDNLTTSIVMVMLIRKLIGNYKERWIFGSIIVIAANSGGAWSPIGDVTTIMLLVVMRLVMNINPP